MSAPAAPKDNSVELANIEAQRDREAREEATRKEAEQRSRFESTLNSSYNTALEDARNYFLSRGLNPDDYTGVIQRAANSARTQVPDLAAAPGTYFTNLGETAFGQEQESQRSKLLRAINSFAGDDFATRRIDPTSDDATLEAILQEQRASADEYVRNLLDRGVITGTGYEAAARDLEQQTYGARSRLNEVGNAELERGRGRANEIASGAKQRASNYTLGETFDPYAVQGQLDQAFADFFANLGNNIRAAVPAGLFSTSGLGNIAGAAQGAGNTAFNPAALAGLGGEDDEDEEERALLSAF